MKKIEDLNMEGKKVLIRCDFNVPIKNGRIIDDTRIKESLKTIHYCIDHHAKIILFSHLGRIKEEEDLKKNTLLPVSKRLSKLLDKKVIFIEETRGKKLEKAIEELQEGEIILVQNTRYEDLDGKKESNNDEELGKYWASLGDLFINDAFGTIHRSHASNVGIASHIESATGFLVEKELNVLSSLNSCEKPFIVILGGAKINDKIGVIEKLVTKADYILIGGGMAFTFLQSEGYNVGASIVDYDRIDFCTKILKKYSSKILLPVDVNVTTEYNNDSLNKVKEITEIAENEMGLDIGDRTIEIYQNYLKDAKTVLWNGPLGVYEFEKYKNGTKKIMKFLVDHNIRTILGGGDIVAAASLMKMKDKVYHASTGGGATLEYLEEKKLPGLEIIK
ncbi:MAG: phosphoglycerate kinase [Bacilli bacterium]|nr:phosphoglycerate kinase [Bacilli bacterium]